MIPSKLRDQVDDEANWILTRGLDNCLSLYTSKRWDELVNRVTEAPYTRKASRQFQRLLFSKAVSVECDKSGRILVPDYLKKIAALHKKVVFVGLADHIEVWDASAWDQLQGVLENDFESLAEDLLS